MRTSLLVLLCAACGSKDATTTKDAAARVPLDAAAAWTDVSIAPFTVAMPGSPSRTDNGGVTANTSTGMYTASVSLLPARLLADVPATQDGRAITIQSSPIPDLAEGTLIEEHDWIVDGIKGHARTAGLGNDVISYTGYLVAGRWLLTTTVIVDRAVTVPPRFWSGVHVVGLTAPIAGSYACDALLAEICNRCGPSACKLPLDRGADAGACAGKSMLMSVTSDDLEHKECALWVKKKRVDLSSLE